MKIKTRFFNLFLAVCLVLSGLAATTPRQYAASADSKSYSRVNCGIG